MVAPLEVNDFNRAKSDIKFIEACVLGIPCLCQNMETYNTAPEALRFDSVEEFEYKISSILNYQNRSNYYGNIKKLRQIGEKRFLEHNENIGAFVESLNTPWGSDERNLLRAWN